MGKEYDDVAYFKGHKGIHIGDGIYKLEEPFVDNVITVFYFDGGETASILCESFSGTENITVMYFAFGVDSMFSLQDYNFTTIKDKRLRCMDGFLGGGLGDVYYV